MRRELGGCRERRDILGQAYDKGRTDALGAGNVNGTVVGQDGLTLPGLLFLLGKSEHQARLSA